MAKKNKKCKKTITKKNRVIKISFKNKRSASCSSNKRSFVKQRHTVTINDMPNEILLKIFSYISLEELFYNIRLVCWRWYILSAAPDLWTVIDVGPEIPSRLLIRWLDRAPNLQILKVENRIDAGVILNKIAKNNRDLRQIIMDDCWGSDIRMNLPSKPLCNILSQFPYLNTISLRGSRFISCRFFQILATRDLIFEKRRRNINHTKRSKKIHYYGGALRKQMRVFLKSRLNNNRNKLALLSVDPDSEDGTEIREEISVNSIEDVERILRTLNFE